MSSSKDIGTISAIYSPCPLRNRSHSGCEVAFSLAHAVPESLHLERSICVFTSTKIDGSKLCITVEDILDVTV
uniref:Uncharacterized protein n=1 Tax=Solanum lycopersicum TaxID=4081 RepID=A0A3Q7G7M3_SOLLC